MKLFSKSMTTGQTYILFPARDLNMPYFQVFIFELEDPRDYLEPIDGRSWIVQ
jgi:hypothetical protein